MEMNSPRVIAGLYVVIKDKSATEGGEWVNCPIIGGGRDEDGVVIWRRRFDATLKWELISG